MISLTAPDRSGQFDDFVLGYDTLSCYLSGRSNFGALIGRCAKRIGAARFSLNGQMYTMAASDGANSLHRGQAGFGKVVWSVAGHGSPGRDHG